MAKLNIARDKLVGVKLADDEHAYLKHLAEVNGIPGISVLLRDLAFTTLMNVSMTNASHKAREAHVTSLAAVTKWRDNGGASSVPEHTPPPAPPATMVRSGGNEEGQS